MYFESIKYFFYFSSFVLYCILYYLLFFHAHVAIFVILKCNRCMSIHLHMCVCVCVFMGQSKWLRAPNPSTVPVMQTGDPLSRVRGQLRTMTFLTPSGPLQASGQESLLQHEGARAHWANDESNFRDSTAHNNIVFKFKIIIIFYVIGHNWHVNKTQPFLYCQNINII